MFVKNKYYFNFFCLFVFIVFSFLFFGLNQDLSNDDQYFLRIYKEGSIFNHLLQRYYGWSGRVFLEAFLIFTIGYDWLWKILMPFSVFILSFSIVRICSDNSNKFDFFIPFVGVLFFLMPPGVVKESIWWVTGFYNYLLPLSCGFLFVYIVFYRDFLPNFYKIISIFLIFLSCSAEQVALFVFFSLLACVLKHRKYDFYIIFVFFLVCACIFILFLAPGNLARSNFELRWFPDYYFYSFLQKISFGVDRLHEHFWSLENVLIPVSFLFSGWIVFIEREKFGLFYLIFIKLVICYFFYYSLLFFCEGNFLYEKLGPVNWGGVKKYVEYFFMFLLFSYLFVLLISLEGGYLVAIYFASAIFLTIAIGFSPTIYASGERIFFLFNISFVVLFVLFIFRALSKNKRFIFM